VPTLPSYGGCFISFTLALFKGLSEKIAINIHPFRLIVAISANQAKTAFIKISIPSIFSPSISALNSIFRQNKVLIGKGTELVLLSYNDMTVLDLQVTF
jgi:hypothetical protein